MKTRHIVLASLGVLTLLTGVASAQYGSPYGQSGYGQSGYNQPNPPPPNYQVQQPPPYYAPQPQPYYQQPPPPDSYYGHPETYKPARDGLTVGFSLGLGAVSFSDGGSRSDGYGGVAGGFFIGAYLSPQIALMFDGEATSFRVGDYQDDAFFTQAIGTVAVKVHLGDKVWVKGGLGFAQLSYEDNFGSAESEPGGAVMVGAGIELWQRRKMSVDLSFNGAVGSYDTGNRDRATVTNGALLVGFNWF